MKITIPVTSDFIQQIPPGGADGFIRTILPFLHSQVDIYGFVFGKGHSIKPQKLHKDVNYHILDNVSRYPSIVPLRLSAFIKYLFNGKKIINEKPDIIYTHSPEVTLAFLLLNPKIPIVFHQHGSANPVSVSKYYWARNSVFSSVFSKMLTTIYKRADHIIAIDNISWNQAVSGGSFQRTSLIKNAVNTETFRPNGLLRQQFRNLYSFSQSVLLLFVGRLEKVKQIDLIIRAIPRIKKSTNKPIKLIIAGEGSQYHELRLMTNELLLEEDVLFWGNVNHNELPALYNAADCLILPSLIEGIPMVILESLACGTPVVASNVGGIPEIVTPGLNGLLFPVESIEEDIPLGVTKLLSMNPRRPEIANSVSTYSAEIVAAQIEDIFSQIAERNAN